MSDAEPRRETAGEAKPLSVDYNSAESVISALQDEATSVDLMELRRPDRTQVLEEVAKWVRQQEGMEDLKEGLLEACLVVNVPQADGDGLVRVDPDLARSLFEVLIEAKAEVPSLLYPFLVLLQSEHRKGLFQESEVLQRLPKEMGVEPETIAESLSGALKTLQDKGILIRYDDGEMFLHRHYIEPSREEALSPGGMPIVVGEHNPDLDRVALDPRLQPLRYKGRPDRTTDFETVVPPATVLPPAFLEPDPSPEYESLDQAERMGGRDALAEIARITGSESVQILEPQRPLGNKEYTKQRLRAMLTGRKDDPPKD